MPAADSGEGRDVFYMISTTMELSPGAPVMKSYDLVNWSTASYLWGALETTDTNALRNGQNAYGQGQWASSLAFHDGTYYAVFNSNNNGHSYLFTASDAAGPWTRHSYTQAFHDPSLFFDGDTPYIFYGADRTNAVRLSADLTTVEATFPNVISRDNFVNQTSPTITNAEFAPSGWEGVQVTQVGDWYYAMAISFGTYGRQTLLFRSRTLLGAAAATADPYAGRVVVGTKAIAQGGLVATRDGVAPDQALVFADFFPAGRVPVLVPVTWSEDPDAWPVFGNGNVGGADQVQFPGSLRTPVQLSARERRIAMSQSIVADDDFANDADRTRWTYPPAAPAQPPVPPGKPVGTEVVGNGGFEAAELTPWSAAGGATATRVTTDVAAGAAAVAVTHRTSTSSGVEQRVSLDPGSRYAISARIKVTEAAANATSRFNVTLDWGNSTGGGQFVNIASGDVTKTGYTTISGTYTVPNRSASDIRLFVESAYNATGSPQNSPEFLVDEVSVRKTAVPGEVHDPLEDADNGSYLDKAWQWNHNPDNRYWSLTEREGWLRLENGRTVTGTSTSRFNLTRFEEARNTLSQRAVYPTTSAETRMDVSGMKDGDTAGLAVYNRQVSFIAARMVGGVKTLGIVNRKATGFAATDPIADGETFIAQTALPTGTRDVWLKADFDLSRPNGVNRPTVQFLYSLDNITWTRLGGANPKLAGFEGNHFKGQRIGLFTYAETSTGGHVDFDYYALSDALGTGVDRADLDWLIAEAQALDPSDYSAAQWSPVARALASAGLVTAPSTQNQVDAAARALNAAVAVLPEPTPDPTTDPTPTPTPMPTPTPTGTPTTPTPTSTPTPPVEPTPARARTTARVKAPRTVRSGARLTVRIVLRSTGTTPTGRVTVRLRGARTVRATLRDGRAVVPVQVRRDARGGRARLRVTYAGSPDHAPAAAQRLVRIVR